MRVCRAHVTKPGSTGSYEAYVGEAPQLMTHLASGPPPEGGGGALQDVGAEFPKP